MLLPFPRSLRSWLRSWPLHAQARASVCLLIALLSFAVAETWVLRAGAQLREDAGSALLQTSRDMADRLSREMAARTRDVQLLSQIDLFRDAGDPEAMRAALERLRATLPAYAWIGVTDVDGNVIAATDDVLLGKSIATRPVFQNGRRGLWSGDVHTAVLLAELAPHKPGESVKFVDAAAPVYGTDGKFRGVLALHMSWQWAAELRDALLKPRAAHGSLQLLVFAADGSLLLAPQDGGTPALPGAQLAMLEERWGTERWSDGVESISAAAESRGTGDFRGFGWRVVARDEHAFGARQVAALRRDAWGWSIAIGATCALLAWWLVGWMVAPVDRLARSLAHPASGLHTQTDTSPAPWSGTPVLPGGKPGGQRRNDVQRISAAVARLQSTLKDRDRAVRQLEQQAWRDPLTGLGNRAHLNELGQRLALETQRAPMEFCVLCLDLDDFKPINDRHGHAAGDQVLVQIGARLRQCARDQDFAFRLGGDEFMLLLPCPIGEGAALARVVAQRVLADLQRPISYLTLTGLRVGCSVGAALWQPGQQTLDGAMALADEALYVAKRAGRGQFRQAAPAALAQPASRHITQPAALA